MITTSLRVSLSLASLMVLCLAACQPKVQPTKAPAEAEFPEVKAALLATTLEFKKNGVSLGKPTIEALIKDAPLMVFSEFDPYYNQGKTWRAFPLRPVLLAQFGAHGLDEAQLKKSEFLLRALDGYQVPISGEKLLGDGAFVAVEDMDYPNWKPVSYRNVNPGPLYMVWRGEDKQDQEAYPRPWQLAQIELADFEALYPHTLPKGVEPGSPAQLGFETFKANCIRCHAINREGGKVGPDLNVPQSVAEYRPKAQLKAYIKNPQTFRYGTMPAFEHLSDAQLDGLIAYFEVMSGLKHDPEASKAP